MLRSLLFKMVCPPHYKYLAFFVYPKDIRVSGAHSSHLFRQEVSGPGSTWPRITGWVHRGSFYPVSLTIWLLYQGKLYSRITYAGQHPLHLPLTAVSASVWLEPLAASTDLSASSRSGNAVATSQSTTRFCLCAPPVLLFKPLHIFWLGRKPRNTL